MRDLVCWLLLVVLWVQSVCARSHSLQYFYSALSHPTLDLPQFFITGFVDDVEIIRFPVEGDRYEPRAPWMRDITAYDEEYWERNTRTSQGMKNVFKSDLQSLIYKHNQTEGLHVLQYMYGCELRSDASFAGFEQWAYDGQDLTDMDRITIKSALDRVRFLQDRWISDPREAEDEKDSSDGPCVDSLRIYAAFGAERLLRRRVRPEFRVSRTITGAGTTLTCYVYGFYPQEIKMKWIRNGVEMPWRSKKILPNPDGTYQAKTKVEVYEGDDVRNYACQVEHSSLEEIVTVVYEEKSLNIGLLAGMIFGVLLLLAAVICGFLLWMKKRSAKEGYSNTSAEPGKDETPDGVNFPHLQVPVEDPVRPGANEIGCTQMDPKTQKEGQNHHRQRRKRLKTGPEAESSSFST